MPSEHFDPDDSFMSQMPDDPLKEDDNMRMKEGININTGVSLGLAVLVIGATVTINNAVNALGMRLQAVELRQAASKEPPKETWTEVDMYRWAVHLQQANKGIPNFKVPEPQHNGAATKEDE